MNEISADTTELLEAAVTAAEFTDELSDEALDRATVGACVCWRLEAVLAR